MMEVSDYMRGGPSFRRPPAPVPPQGSAPSQAVMSVQKCVACRHGMVTKADDEARPTYYCLLAGVEIQRIVTECTKFAEAKE